MRWLSLTPLAGAVALAVVLDTGRTPPPQPPDVMDYGVLANAPSSPNFNPQDLRAVSGKAATVSCSPTNTATFTFTITARGPGAVHYTLRPAKNLSHLPVRNETITFIGPTETKNIVYTVPLTGSNGQRLQGGMTVEITAQGSYLGASYDQFELTCSQSGVLCAPPSG